MNMRIVFLVLGASCAAFAQDMKIESPSSNSELLRVENTGTSYKTALKVMNSVGSPAHGQGIHVIAAGNAIQAEATGSTGAVNQALFLVADNAPYNIGVNAAYIGTGLAGLFQGDVVVNGTFSNPSDQKFKTDVQSLQGGLDMVMALKPRTYRMKVSEFKDKVHLADGKQFGLIAQEVAPVIPELVHDIKAPPKSARNDVKMADLVEYKSVDYVALIPVLLAAIQEQQRQIQQLQGQINVK